MARLGKSPFDDAGGLSANLESNGPGVVDGHFTGDLTVDGTINSSGDLLSNNEFLQARNAADSADLDLLKADASNNTVLNAATTKKVSLTVAGTEEASIDATGLNLPLGNGVFFTAGANGKAGTVTVNGVTPVAVATTAFLAGSVVAFSLKTVGGTVGQIPHLVTATPATGFTVAATASDTSVYNWVIIDTE